jgi:hypothetical protein
MRKKIVILGITSLLIGLGVLLFPTFLSSADEVKCNETKCTDCPAIAPTGSSEESIDNTPEMEIIHNSPDMIEIEVDCWHLGHCWVCDEYRDYDCSPYGWYGGYAEYNYGIYDGWEPCPFSDPTCQAI